MSIDFSESGIHSNYHVLCYRTGFHNTLIEGHFDYCDADKKKQVGCGKCSSVHLPLAIAAVAGATKSIATLLQVGVCPKGVDCNGNNVVHSIIAFLFYHLELEDMIIAKF